MINLSSDKSSYRKFNIRELEGHKIEVNTYQNHNINLISMTWVISVVLIDLAPLIIEMYDPFEQDKET